MPNSLIVDAGLLKTHVTESVPLRAALRVESEDVVVRTDLVGCASFALSEVDDLVLEGLAASHARFKMIQAQVQLYSDARLNLSGRLQYHIGSQEVESYVGKAHDQLESVSVIKSP